MALVNYKIYTIRFISEELLAQFIPKVCLLETQTNTSISFSFVGQFFQVEGDNNEDCEEAVDTINSSLIPILNHGVKSAFDGTFMDVITMKPNTQTDSNHKIDRNVKQYFTLNGKPLDGIDDKDVEEYIEDGGLNQEELSYTPELIVKEFHISSHIKNIEDFLIGPPQMNMRPAEYINLIPRLTNTECMLQNRCIVITGENSCVDDAFNRFKVLENIYIAHSKVTRIACIHYPHISGHYGLYFCKLRSYKQKRYVHLYQQIYNPYVILPVFLDCNTNEYARPNDLIIGNNLQIDLNINYKTNNTKKIEQNSINTPHTPDSPTPIQLTSIPLPATTDRKSYTPVKTNSNLLNSPPPPSVMEFYIPEIPKLDADTFPVLAPSSPRNTAQSGSQKGKRLFSSKMSNEKVRVNRVMRIVSQKSANQSIHQNPHTVTERVKAYNYNNIKNVLEKGLDSLRGFKGEIRLSARLGKVLWTNVPVSVEEKIWNYHDINDILMKELGVAPKFTSIATIYDNYIESMSSENILQQKRPFMKTAIYEFHCMARNQPKLPYKRTIIHMNEGVIDVKKVVLKEKVTTEIDWISLDRKFDFQLYIATRLLTRENVKPYSTFIKTVSICPITRLMSFENIPKFLKVDYVLLKKTTKFKIALPFVVEITQVEEVPLRPVPNTAKINAQPGSNKKVWYEYEVINTMDRTTFEENLDLEVGKEAKWTSNDILNPTLNGSGFDTITDCVKNMLTIIERIEKAM